MAEDEADKTRLLRFEDVTVAFDDVVALDRITFEVCPGQTKVVLGAAGSGKTTLLKAAIGLVRTTSGRIFLFGRDITGMAEKQLFELQRQGGSAVSGGRPVRFVHRSGQRGLSSGESKQAVRVPEDQVLQKVEDALKFVELTIPWINSPANSRAGCGAGWESRARQ